MGNFNFGDFQPINDLLTAFTAHTVILEYFNIKE